MFLYKLTIPLIVKLFIIRRRCYSVNNVMSYNSYYHTCNNTKARMRNGIGNVRVNSAFSH